MTKDEEALRQLEDQEFRNRFLSQDITEKLSELLERAHMRLSNGDVLPRDESIALVMECQRLIDAGIAAHQRFLDLAGHLMIDKQRENMNTTAGPIWDFRTQYQA